VDIEELKYEVQSGQDIKNETKVYNPFHDLTKFENTDLQRTNKHLDDFAAPKRPRPDALEFQDPYPRESKLERSHRNVLPDPPRFRPTEDPITKVEEWEKNEGSIVSEAQRNKAKELLLKNIKKNP
jgi:hypothetical protein